eukprot:58362-Prymnesium_polylepis.2
MLSSWAAESDLRTLESLHRRRQWIHDHGVRTVGDDDGAGWLPAGEVCDHPHCSAETGQTSRPAVPPPAVASEHQRQPVPGGGHPKEPVGRWSGGEVGQHHRQRWAPR